VEGCKDEHKLVVVVQPAANLTITSAATAGDNARARLMTRRRSSCACTAGTSMVISSRRTVERWRVKTVESGKWNVDVGIAWGAWRVYQSKPAINSQIDIFLSVLQRSGRLLAGHTLQVVKNT
jgi:hypothetical protein